VDLLPAEDCETVALGITSLIDGLWLRLGLQSEGLTRDTALSQMRDYLAHRIPAT
jgi:TetR/AcrR family transcriptional repressor of bet genes